MINLHASTLALSVYNVLMRCGSVTPEQAVAILRRDWEPEFDAEDCGIARRYLETRGYLQPGELRPTRTRDSLPWPLIRAENRPTELVYAP